MSGPAPEVCARWRIRPGPVLGNRPAGTWAATRGGQAYVLKFFDELTAPDWRYQLRAAAALRAQGSPVPEPAEEPYEVAGGAWVLFHRLPGRSRRPSGDAVRGERLARGRLLAEFHAAAAATGITAQRGGFAGPAEVVADPELERWLRVHERHRPDEGRALRACREETAAWFAAHPVEQAPHSIIHGDFAPWNLLFDDAGRLTGIVDFEAVHHSVQVADFALSWRGYQDDVLRGYDEVRPLSGLEWQLIRPSFHAWLFLFLADDLATAYRGPGPAPVLAWQMAHLRKHSPLLARRAPPP